MTEWIQESDLAQRLGINRSEMRRLRRHLLVLGVDFKVEKNRVEISGAGVAKLETHLKLPGVAAPAVQTTGGAAPAPDSPAEKTAPPARTDEVFHVRRTFPKNLHILEAYRPGTDPEKMDNRVRVKVKDTSRFTRFDNTGKPMALTARKIAEGFYEHTGPLPKKKGRV